MSCAHLVPLNQGNEAANKRLQVDLYIGLVYMYIILVKSKQRKTRRKMKKIYININIHIFHDQKKRRSKIDISLNSPMFPSTVQ